ncbi:hypothetical protein OCH239_17985 [Roseivivax halodurans JCM 10272]|uniref:Mg chelatase-related protein C-terminal domain-containing protein n=1 Tax=Roseivivax halodurans JCM 10272 TaxID=1449350 RepID=X7EHC0_9RHOB|nr:hypothetical protein OCH239_17985 [Roseivivax halodurans JCM 10272]
MSEARSVQAARFANAPGAYTNADAQGGMLETIMPDAAGKALLTRAADRLGLSARGYHRVIRVARTIADLEGSDGVSGPHVAEALSYRLAFASSED